MRLRLTIITSLLALLAVLIMGTHSALHERRLLLQESMVAKGQALVTTLAVPCLEALASSDDPDHQRLDHYLAGLTDQPELDVHFAAVIDDEGRIVSHTDPEKYGQTVTDPFMRRAVRSTVPIHETTRDEAVGDVIEFAQPLAIEHLRWGTLVVGVSIARVEAQLRAGYLTSGLSAFLIIGPLALLLYQLFSRNIVRPVLALAEGVKQVGQGNLSTQVDARSVSRADELGQLVAGFNTMVEGLREREQLKGELEVARRLEETHARLETTHAQLETTHGQLETAHGELESAHTQLEATHTELAITHAELETTYGALEKAHEDLTRVHEDLKTTQGQLIQAEKMAALGELVAGVAHEINNPVNYLVQSIELLREHIGEIEAGWQTGQEVDPEQFSDLKRLMRIMTEGAERTAGIVRKLRDFSRQESPRLAPVTLEPVLDSSIELLRYEIKGRIEVVRCYEQVEAVEGDAAQLGQVFLNLLNNAAQAIPGDGRITVSLGQDDQRVWVQIDDTGPGIPPERVARIFNPFYTTKEVGKGTGLGLSLSYRIIQRHGGEILVESPPGQGARFIVKLPRAGLRSSDGAA